MYEEKGHLRLSIILYVVCIFCIWTLLLESVIKLIQRSISFSR